MSDDNPLLDESYQIFGSVLSAVGCVFIVCLLIYHTLRLYNEYSAKGTSVIFNAKAITSVDPVEVANMSRDVSPAPELMNDGNQPSQADIVASKSNSTQKNEKKTGDGKPAPLYRVTTIDILQHTREVDPSQDPLQMKHIKNIKFAHVLTYVCMMSSFINSLTFLLGWVDVSFTNSIGCAGLLMLLGVSYAFSKISLYLVFVLRLKIAYFDIISNCTFYSLYCLIGIYFTIYIAINLTFVIDNNTFAVDFNGDIKVCSVNNDTQGVNIVNILAVLSLLIDIVIQFYYVRLFIKPLLSLSKESISNNNNKQVSLTDEQMHTIRYIMVKYGLMTSMTVFTSMVAIIPLLFNAGVTIVIDNCCNCLAIILMSSIHNNFYNKICCFCHHRLSQCGTKK